MALSLLEYEFTIELADMESTLSVLVSDGAVVRTQRRRGFKLKFIYSLEEFFFNFLDWTTFFF
jgi:hypothetical protein